MKYNLSDSSMTIDNVIHGVQDRGIVRIDIEGERNKALFQCKACGNASEYDCTEGIKTITCSYCNSSDLELKSPIVNVIAGVRGIPTPQVKMSKAEMKKNRFIKNCYQKTLELQHLFKVIIAMLKSLSYPESEIEILNEQFDMIVYEIDDLQKRKIEEYSKKDDL